jgi:RHS repeat-associated protein
VTYDYNNRVTNMSEENKYAPDGTRVYEFNASVIGNTGVGMMSDTTGNPILWLSGNSPRLYRIFGPSIDDVVAENDLFTGKIRFLHKDALGSITLVTGEDGTRGYRTTYKAFGQATSTPDLGAGHTTLGYTGRELGSWSTMYYRARHYDINTGRFLQQDTYRGASDQPPSLHRYVYCFNDPVRYVDPSGNLGVALAGLAFVALAFYMAYQVYEFFANDFVRVIEELGDDFEGQFARIVTIMGYEAVMLTVAAVYLEMGWALLSSGWPSLAYLKSPFRLGKQTANFMALSRVARGDFWQLAIGVTCFNVIRPLVINRDVPTPRQLAVSMTFCWLISNSTLKALGVSGFL